MLEYDNKNIWMVISYACTVYTCKYNICKKSMYAQSERNFLNCLSL